MQRDYYRLLGVTRSASADEIKLAYRRLAQRLHPDVSPNPQDVERFKEIAVAYHVLRDADRRVRYDIEAMEADLEASERELNAAREILANGYAEAAAASVQSAASGLSATWEADFVEDESAPPEYAGSVFGRLARRRPEPTGPAGYRVAGDDYEVVG